MITQFITRRINQIPLILLFTACGALAMPALAQEQIAASEGTQYRVSGLDSLGGTSSAGNSIKTVLGCRLFQADWRSSQARGVMAAPDAPRNTRSRDPRRAKQ